MFPAHETKRRALPNWLRHCVTCPHAEACEERGRTEGSTRQSRLSHASPTIDFLGYHGICRFDSFPENKKALPFH
jgi:hypothetical protein